MELGVRQSMREKEGFSLFFLNFTLYFTILSWLLISNIIFLRFRCVLRVYARCMCMSCYVHSFELDGMCVYSPSISISVVWKGCSCFKCGFHSLLCAMRVKLIKFSWKEVLICKQTVALWPTSGIWNMLKLKSDWRTRHERDVIFCFFFFLLYFLSIWW